MNEYQPVPVEAARQIGQQLSKAIVCIVAIDSQHDLLHVTTWGDSADRKYQAARLGDSIARWAGADLNRRTNFEDFRTRPAAESAQVIDQLTQQLRIMRSLAERVVAECDEVFVDPAEMSPEWVAIYNDMKQALEGRS